MKPFKYLKNQAYKYGDSDDYKADKYWTDRLAKFKFDLRGVGDKGLSHKKNKQMYLEAKEIFLSLCREQNINFNNVRVLDVGCGTGFYARILLEKGIKQYLGVDITDTLFKKLNENFPNFKFSKLDITNQKLNDNFDLIIMIDVTQHITNSTKFSFAMKNIKSCLSENGIFIVTSWLDKNARKSFYEVSRSMEDYKKEMPDYIFSDPIPFRDKFIFSIRKPGREI